MPLLKDILIAVNVLRFVLDSEIFLMLIMALYWIQGKFL